VENLTMKISSQPVGSLSLLALCAALLLACQEGGEGDFFGSWDEPPDGGSRDGGMRDGGGNPDGAGLVCMPSVIGSWSAPRSMPLPDHRAPDDDDDDGDDDDDEKYLKPDPRCLSGWRWTGGDHESELMQPGSDCIDCHREGYEDDDDVPIFALAGTVYGALSEPTDCLGLGGVTVRITDAQGKKTDLRTNRAGNFYIEARRARIALPFTAEVLYQGRSRAMLSPRCETSCNVCHTSSGENGAPGRILAP
jgi:hypothetical protein